jgi:hypothetical protein
MGFNLAFKGLIQDVGLEARRGKKRMYSVLVDTPKERTMIGRPIPRF